MTRSPVPELERSERRFRSLVEAFSTVIWICDGAGNFIPDDPSWTRFTGQSGFDCRDRGWINAVHPDDRERLRSLWSKSSPSSYFELDFRLRHRSGMYRSMHCRGVRLPGEGGGIDECVGKCNDLGEAGTPDDLAELRAAADRLRESEERFRIMADGAPFIIWMHDADGKVTFVNRAYRDFFQVTLDQVQGDGWKALLHPEDEPAYVATFVESVRTHSPWQHAVRVRRASDGQWRWLLSQTNPRFSATGEYLGVVGASPDITEQKQAELALRASETQLRLITDSLPVLVSYIDPGYRYRFANGTYTKWFGLSHEEVIGATMKEVLGEQVFQGLKPFFDRALKGETVHFENIAHYRNRSREIRGIYVPDLGPDGVVRGFIVLIEDISERKQSERQLVASEERLRLATAAGGVGVWEADPKTRKVNWTESLYKIMGVSPERFQPTIESFRSLVHPEDRELLMDHLEAVRASGKRLQFEFRGVRPDGAMVWLHTSTFEVKDEHGERFVGTLVDITELKRVETELRRANKDSRTVRLHRDA